LVWAGRRDGVVRIVKDVVLGAIAEIVEVCVKGWGVGTLVHVISFLLEPVEGTLGAVSAITGRGVHNTVSRVSTTSARELRCGHRNVRGSSSDVALEPGHIVLLATT